MPEGYSMKIYCDSTPNLDQFDEFIGKDLWIWVDQTDEPYKDFYIKVISREGDKIKHFIISGELMEAMETGEGFYSGERFSVENALSGNPMYLQTSNITDWAIYPGTPVYTTADLQELMDATGDVVDENNILPDEDTYVDDGSYADWVNSWGISGVE